jgi:hypothetical protein
MLESGGGGLNLNVCQFVDWMFYVGQFGTQTFIAGRSSHLEMIRALSIILVYEFREDYEGITYE